MPRKQRFKPSRKPKPAEMPVETNRVSSVDPSDEPTRPYETGRTMEDIESAEPARSRTDSSAVIEESTR